MAKSKWIALVCLVAMLAMPGCSSSSGGGDAELKQLEDQVSGALQAMSVLLTALNPFSPAPPAPAPKSNATTIVDCVNVDQGYCNISGEVLECTTVGEAIEIDFAACVGSQTGPQGTVDYDIDGVVSYTPDRDWPSGSTDVVIGSDTTGDWAFDMAYDGTDQVQIDVTDPQGAQADCVGSLETFEADCEWVVQPMM
jgi:hypothetical protein